MITCVSNVLIAEELARIGEGLASASFSDGSATAGWHAREVKRNLQLGVGAPGYEALSNIIRAALGRNALLQSAVRPRIAMPVLFNRHEQGMHYGNHVDDAVMLIPGGGGRAVRTDVAITIFLSPPQSYAGGELVVESGGTAQRFKLEAGAAIAYPANSLHRVEPVTDGVRMAAIIWLQSEIRHANQREILFDLDTAARSVFASEGKSKTFDLLSKSHSNLLRLWAEL